MKTIVSNESFVSLTEVERLQKNTMAEGEEGEKAEAEFLALKEMLNDESPDLEYWDVDLLQKIDGVAREAFADCELQIGLKTDEYSTALAVYADKVTELIKKVKANHDLTPSVLAKFVYLMNDASGIIEPLPILTASVMDSLLLSFSHCSEAIDMVSPYVIGL